MHKHDNSRIVWRTIRYHEASQNVHQIVVRYTTVVYGTDSPSTLDTGQCFLRAWPLLVVHYVHNYSIQDMFANPVLTLPAAWHVHLTRNLDVM
jgi:hypothetical protein